MARPKKYNIDKEQVKKLATLGCTNKEIGDFSVVVLTLLKRVIRNI